MFTHTSDRQAIRSQVARGEDNTIGLIGDIEQDSALLASEDNAFLLRMGVSRDLLTDPQRLAAMSAAAMHVIPLDADDKLAEMILAAPKSAPRKGSRR